MSAKPKPPQTQIIRRGSEIWDVLQVSELWPGAHEYEVIGRVVLHQGLYYVEYPKWLPVGMEWERQARGYMIPIAAFKTISERKRKWD